ncbi:MAG: glycosyltransferase [Sphingobacteriaceae bacterium]|nr:glycosyltransferase [Sphingobacteriaceae bacterium]
MPKILRIINRFNLGGPSYNVSYLSKFLEPAYNTLLAGGPEEPGEVSSLYIAENLGLKPLVISEMQRSINPLNDYFAYLRIKKIIQEFKPDIIHTHASKAGAIGRLAAIRCKVPVIVHTFHGHVFHSYFSKLKTAFIIRLEKYFASRSSAIVAISEIQKKELSEVYKICAPEKIHVIPLGFDLAKFQENAAEKRSKFRDKYTVDENTILIGIIGRFAPIKNHFLFIKAVAFVLKNFTAKKIQAVFVGDGPLKNEMQQLIKSEGLSYTGLTADFIFAGWEKEVEQVLPAFDLVCMSSDNEGTPVSLIEAQAAGKFVVSTNVGGIEDILNPQCGLLSPKGDLTAFSQNLLKALQNIEIFSANAKMGQEEIIKKFSYERLCSDMDKLYKKLLSEKK